MGCDVKIKLTEQNSPKNKL